VLSHAAFWPLAVWFFFNCAVFFSFGGMWGGPYMRHVYGLSTMEYGSVLSMIAVGMLVGSPLLSFLSDHVFRGRKPVLILSSVVVLIVAGILAFATDRIPRVGLYLVCLGLGTFSSAIVVIAFTAAKELFPVQIAGTATGLINLFPFAGGAVFQYVLGRVLDHHGKEGDAFVLAGYQRGFLVLFGCAVVALLASLFLRETMRR
jgi:sugar phosphate permease